MLTDAHLHLGDMKNKDGYSDLNKISIAFTCTAKSEEWTEKTDLAHCRIKRFYGIHPWYCSEWTPQIRHRLIDVLENNPESGVGEIGLDARHGCIAEQTCAFTEQMEISKINNRPTVIHSVSTDEKILEILRIIKPEYPTIIHSFHSDGYTKAFDSLGCYFSINPRILAKKPETVSRIIRSIPMHKLLLESDAPNVPNNFTGMEDFTEKISKIIGTTHEKLKETLYENMERIL